MMVKYGMNFSPSFFLFFGACCAHGALACQEKQSGLDRTVEAMCQNATKNSQRPITGTLTGKNQHLSARNDYQTTVPFLVETEWRSVW
jgi:hypothetical protein